MIEALLHGKLSREQENMEDILTSNVFGLLKYVGSEQGLLPFLAQAESVDGGKPLAELATLESAEVAYDFWPPWQEQDCEFCEPDVVLRIRSPGRRLLMVLVEAKFRSGKSSEADEQEGTPPNDQLAKEWDNLTHMAEREGATPVLVYLTADVGVPRQDIEDSVREYQGKRGDEGKHPAIYWLSWRHLGAATKGSREPFLQDLQKLLERLGLVFFSGVGKVPVLRGDEWSFGGIQFDWGAGTCPGELLWRFSA